MTFPTTLLMHDAFGECTTEVSVRLVRAWNAAENAMAEASLHFDTDGDGGSPRARQPRLSDIDEDSINGSPTSLPTAPPAPAAPVLDLWARIIARHQANLAHADALEGADGLPTDSPCPLPRERARPTETWDRLLARRMASQFPDAGLNASQWYDTIAAPVPIVDEDTAVQGEDAAAEAVEAADPPPDTLGMEIMAPDFLHEDSARKLRVRHKRAADSAFKARRSARLAAKEAPTFLTMLSKAKAAKASKFDLSGGSTRFRAAAEAAGFGGSSDPGPIPVQRLRELAAVCGVDPDTVDDASEVLPLSA